MSEVAESEATEDSSELAAPSTKITKPVHMQRRGGIVKSGFAKSETEGSAPSLEKLCNIVGMSTQDSSGTGNKKTNPALATPNRTGVLPDQARLRNASSRSGCP